MKDGDILSVLAHHFADSLLASNIINGASNTKLVGVATDIGQFDRCLPGFINGNAIVVEVGARHREKFGFCFGHAGIIENEMAGDVILATLQFEVDIGVIFIPKANVRSHRTW